MTRQHPPETQPPIARRVDPRRAPRTRIRPRSWSGLAGDASIVLLALALVVIFVVTLVLTIPPLFKDNGPGITTITATPPSPFALPGLNQITWAPSGLYVFPIAADPAYYTWTHTNRSVPNSVALEARLGLTQAEYNQVTRASVIAVTSGVVRAFNDSTNGLGYTLQGDDGLDYYYAHLDQQTVPDGSRVNVAQILGIMGTTGGAARYLERQVRFAVGLRGEPLASAPATNAAEWINATFGLHWAERSAVPAPYSWPRGWPVQSPVLVIATGYDQALSHGLPESAIEFGFIGTPRTEPQNVYATLDGTVNVIRWTEPYGTRIQITNEAALFTVIVSGLDSWAVQDGQVVTRGQVIGQWTPVIRPHLHYMIFQNGVNIDPEPTLR